MGILHGLLGNASEIDAEEVEKEITPLIVEGETIDKAYKVIRDLFIFTNKRFILVDKQGITGHKVEYRSIPYSDISQFSIETAGHFDMDAELKIWVRGHQQPIVKEFKKGSPLHDVQKHLATYVLKHS